MDTIRINLTKFIVLIQSSSFFNAKFINYITKSTIYIIYTKCTYIHIYKYKIDLFGYFLKRRAYLIQLCVILENTSNCKMIGHFSIENYHLPGTTLQYFCIFNRKFQKKLAFRLQFATGDHTNDCLVKRMRFHPGT